MAIFPPFFFRRYKPAKCLLWHSKTKKHAFLGYKNKKFKNIVLVQKWPFFQVFFLDNIGQENVFDDILEQKNPF